MSTRWLLLALPLVAVATILVLLLGGEDDESVSAPAVTSAPAANGDGARDLPLGALRGEVMTAAPDVDAAAGNDGSDALGADDATLHGVIRGRLVDGAGRPVADEPVRLVVSHDAWLAERRSRRGPGDLAALVRTDAEGAFAAPAGIGRRHLLVAGGDRWPGARLSDVTAGANVTLVLPEAYRLEGVVVEEESGQPVSGAEVFAVAGDARRMRGPENLRASAVTDGEGRFALGPLPGENVTVAAYADGHDVELRTEVAPALGEVRLALPPARPLYGRVYTRGDDGVEEPVPGASLRFALELMQAGEAPGTPGDAGWPLLVIEEREVVTDAFGEFDLGLGPSVGFILHAEAEGFVPRTSTRHVERPVSAEGEIRMSLERAEAWQGTVVDGETGAPEAGARLSAVAEQGVISETLSDDDGLFALPMTGWDGVGRVHVHAETDDGRHARARVRRKDDLLGLHLTAPVALEVLVRSGGAPVPGAEVRVSSFEAQSTIVRADGEGRAQLTHRLSHAGNRVVTLRARLRDVESLPLHFDPDSDPLDEPVVLDLQDGVAVAGTVVDSYGRPVPTAALRVDEGGTRTHSDAEGRFELAPVAPDAVHRTSVWAEGHHGKTVDLTAGDPEAVVVLEPVVLLEGRVFSIATGAPMTRFVGNLYRERMRGQSVEWQRLGNARVKRLPGDGGEFTVSLPEPGRYLVELKANDHVPVRSLPFDFDGTVPPPYQELAMASAAVLEATILDGRGEPVSGLTVMATPVGPDGKPDKSGRKSSRTRADGRVRLNLHEGGTFRVTSGGKKPLEEALVLRGGLVEQRVYRLPATGGLEVRVWDENGQPLSEVTLRVRTAKAFTDHNLYRRTRLRAPDHVGIVEGLPAGDYTVQASRRGKQGTARIPVSVSAHRIQGLDVTLTPRQTSPQRGVIIQGRSGRGRSSVGGLDKKAQKQLIKLGYLEGGR